MHASIYSFGLGSELTSRERWLWSRSLAAALDALQGFVAFIALEAEDGVLAGLCVCVDAAALAEAQRVADAWQRECAGRADGAAPIQTLIAGEVITQRGF